MADVIHDYRSMRLDPDRPHMDKEGTPHSLAFSRDLDTLNGMKKSELVALAEQHGIEVTGTGAKGTKIMADYVEALSAA